MAPIQKQKKKLPSTYSLNIKKVNDAVAGVFNLVSFEKFLIDRIKVQNRTNNLSSNVVVTRSDLQVTVTVSNGTVFAKRYLKYLTKKFLKKEGKFRDLLRVVAVDKSSYELRFYNVDGMDDDEAEE